MKNVLSFNLESANDQGHYIKVEDTCVDCDACLAACPNGIPTTVFRKVAIARGKPVLSAMCEGCKACEDNCPVEAISIS